MICDVINFLAVNFDLDAFAGMSALIDLDLFVFCVFFFVCTLCTIS